MRLEFGEFTLDHDTRQLRRGGTELHLEPKALELLGLLLERRPQAVAKPEIRDRLWPASFVSESNLTGLVAQVREALGDDPRQPRYIRTVHGYGYAFAGTAEAAPTSATAASAEPAAAGVEPVASIPASAGDSGEGRSRRARWALVAVVVLALAGGSTSLVRSLVRRPPPAAMAIAPFTSYPGLELAPTFSPDGSQIAFTWTGAAAGEGVALYTKVVGSEKALRLTTTHADMIKAAWAPDGRRIAFARSAGDRSGIYLISALGGPERKLADVVYDFELEAHLSWSPDGTQLAFSEGPPRSAWAVTVLDVATLRKRRLDPPAPECQWSWMPAFAPDGRTLARVCLISINVNDVFVEPASGGTARRVARVGGEFSGLAWAGDGKSLLVAADGDLTRFPVDGGAAEKLLAGRDVDGPAVSHDGRRLAYAQRAYTVNIWRVPLATSNKAGEGPVRLIASSRQDMSPTFSPDGRRLAFASTRTGSPEIWISDADGANPHAVTAFGGPLTGSPRWSPDGRSIALDSRASDRADIYIVDSEGGAPRRIETGQPDSETPWWSADGEWIYFSARVEGSSQVFKVARTGGRAIRLTSGGGEVPQVARDGRRVYYQRGGRESPLWSASTSGGDERPVTGMPAVPPARVASWDLHSDGIYFVQDGAAPALYYLDFAAGQARRVADLPGTPAGWSGISLSPDGHSVLIAMLEQATSDIMIVENFH